MTFCIVLIVAKLRYMITKVCASPTNSTWFTSSFLLVRRGPAQDYTSPPSSPQPPPPPHPPPKYKAYSELQVTKGNKESIPIHISQREKQPVAMVIIAMATTTNDIHMLKPSFNIYQITLCPVITTKSSNYS